MKEKKLNKGVRIALGDSLSPTEKLKRDRQTAGQVTFSTRMKNARSEEKVSEQGNTYQAAVVECLYPKAKNPVWKTRSKPLWTTEGKLVADCAPFDEDSVYKVTAEKNDDGFLNWTNIEKMEK